MAVLNSKEAGNDAFVFGPYEEGKSRISVIPFRFDDTQFLSDLLGVRNKDELGIHTMERPGQDHKYMMLFNSLRTPPYPVALVAKYAPRDRDMLLLDMEKSDLEVVQVIRARFMKPEAPSIPLAWNPDWDGADAALLTQLGYAYEKGTIFQQDYKAALALYEKAGLYDPLAINNTGWMYQNGLGVEQNPEQAKTFYELAAEGGCTAAMVNLGNLYQFGTLGEPDYDQCFRWYQKAAEAGDKTGLFNYANCFHHGYGVNRNYEIAFPIFRQLEREGYPGASFYVGLYYQEGYGVEQDYERARVHYRRGALQDDRYCWNQLGVLYAKGLGVEQNMAVALDYYLAAALLGDALAYTNIGWFYENGDMGEPDPDQAIRFYRRAASEGEEHALEALERLGVPMEGERKDE